MYLRIASACTLVRKYFDIGLYVLRKFYCIGLYVLRKLLLRPKTKGETRELIALERWPLPLVEVLHLLPLAPRTLALSSCRRSTLLPSLVLPGACMHCLHADSANHVSVAQPRLA